MNQQLHRILTQIDYKFNRFIFSSEKNQIKKKNYILNFFKYDIFKLTVLLTILISFQSYNKGFIDFLKI